MRFPAPVPVLESGLLREMCVLVETPSQWCHSVLPCVYGEVHESMDTADNESQRVAWERLQVPCK
jgi:hypothetical protein